MKQVIDEVMSLEGWAGTGSAAAHSLCEIEEYIANDNDTSVILFFPENSSNESIEKSIISTDLSKFNEIVFSIASRDLGVAPDHIYKPAEYKYKIDFGWGEEYYIAPGKTMTDITIAIPTNSTLNKIKITALSNNEDYLFLSHVVAVKDELPLDIFTSFQEKIRPVINELTRYQIGTVTANAGAKSINIANRDWLERYMIVEIDDGTNSEKHYIKKEDSSGNIYFGKSYDGEIILNTYINAPVYIYFPVTFNNTDTEAAVPGMVVWSISRNPIYRDSKEEVRQDTHEVSTGNSQTYKSRQIFILRLLIDIEAKHMELLAHLASALVRFVARNALWINGRKFEIEFDGAATEINFNKEISEIHKLQHPIIIEYKEDIWPRQSKVAATAATLAIAPRAQR